ncbi:MAG: hypothetical protein J3K34DRAFT_443506 [Monoraphidium minutum]|nr:MAG: hypothetical protein J3K34DRAFT_443506 [Monoraphidium minutum]
MGPGEAVTIEMFSDGPRTVAFVNGQQVDPAELLATGGAAAGAASYGDDSYDDYAAESELFESPDGLGLDRALVVVMSFVCAATFVAFVRSLVQLRAAMRGAGGEPASPLYLTLPSAEDEAGCKVEAYNPARASYRAPRRSSGAGGLEHPLLPGGGADVSGARVMVVVPGVVCARDEAAAAAGVQSYGNEAFYQPLPDAERKA